ncbi:MAG TPA: hypothetical protein VNG71_18650 [Pyrinomonadaceae bacterium]|nr:hypothetical protein [Pyrinomonadaceae bacterium]
MAIAAVMKAQFDWLTGVEYPRAAVTKIDRWVKAWAIQWGSSSSTAMKTDWWALELAI